jgi:uncharacterized repeat protein (TIGR03847 family)
MSDIHNSFPFDNADDAMVQVEALGEPGQRRFRLMAYVHGETHILWMEKQQVQALGMAIEQMLDQLPPGVGGSESLPGEVKGSFDPGTRSQFRVGRIELGFDVGKDRIVISAHDMIDDDEAGMPAATGSVNLRITRVQAQHLSEEAASLVAAGRPRCPMCGAPMDPEGHVCPEQNGHLPFALDESDVE